MLQSKLKVVVLRFSKEFQLWAALLFTPFKMTAPHRLWADRCLSASVQPLNGSSALRAMGGNHHFGSLIPGCKHLTRACPDRIYSSPVKSPSVCVRVCGCTHKREGPLLCYRLGHGHVALIIPLSANNKSLAACHSQQAKLVIIVMGLDEKGSEIVLLEVFI